MESGVSDTGAATVADSPGEVMPSAEIPATVVSASTRVLDLPELLDNILLSIADDQDDPQTHKDPTVTYTRPLKCLFALQRVNHAFKAMISRNKTLQRRMFLEVLSAHDKTSSSQDHYISPLRFLLDEIGVQKNGNSLIAPKDKIPRGYQLLNFRRKPSVRRHVDKNPEASWRKMELHGVYDRSVGFWINVPVFDNFPLAVIDRQHRSTLGKLHDVLVGLMPFAEELDDHMILRHSGDLETAPDETTEELEWIVDDRLHMECARKDLWD